MFSYRLSDSLSLVMAEPALAEAIYAEADRSRATLMPWMPWAEHNSLDGTRAWIRASQEQWARNEGFQAVILEHGQVAGVVGYVYARAGRAELGYWLGEGFRGRGIMARAVRVVAEDAHTRLNIHRVEVLCRVDNLRSRAVAERLGIPLEGILRGWWPDAQGRHDIALYARIATDPWTE
ncbi:MAG TPA: GNAT family protein [Myxococcota bacterium]|nr:GNAT family protein [Myxococcota bacterium]